MSVDEFMNRICKESYERYKGIYNVTIVKSDFNQICVCIKSNPVFSLSVGYLYESVISYKRKKSPYLYGRKYQRLLIAVDWVWIAQFGIGGKEKNV